MLEKLEDNIQLTTFCSNHKCHKIICITKKIDQILVIYFNLPTRRSSWQTPVCGSRFRRSQTLCVLCNDGQPQNVKASSLSIYSFKKLLIKIVCPQEVVYLINTCCTQTIFFFNSIVDRIFAGIILNHELVLVCPSVCIFHEALCVTITESTRTYVSKCQPKRNCTKKYCVCCCFAFKAYSYNTVHFIRLSLLSTEFLQRLQQRAHKMHQNIYLLYSIHIYLRMYKIYK